MTQDEAKARFAKYLKSDFIKFHEDTEMCGQTFSGRVCRSFFMHSPEIIFFNQPFFSLIIHSAVLLIPSLKEI